MDFAALTRSPHTPRSPGRPPLVFMFCTILLVSGVLTGGCPTPSPPPPPPPSRIAGVWEFTTSANPSPPLLLMFEFDSAGDADWVLYQLGTNPTVLDERPRGTTSVSGSSVSMNLRFGDNFFNNFVFTGTLDAANRTMTGRATVRVSQNGVAINLPSAPAVLIRRGTE